MATEADDIASTAVGLYALLHYDPSDFVDDINNRDTTTDECLKLLYKMFVLPNPKHNESTKETNRLGKSFVTNQMKKRGIIKAVAPANDNEHFEFFLNSSRKVASEFGRPDPRLSLSLFVMDGVVGPTDEAKVYEDDHVIIKISTTAQTMEIEKKENRNPVVYINPDGSVLRTHGEYRDIYQHVMGLAEGLV